MKWLATFTIAGSRGLAIASLFCAALQGAETPNRPDPSEKASHSPTASSALHRIDPQTPNGLQELFKFTEDRLPFVSAHRGGAQPGYPENCIATFENTLKHTFAILEIDPRYAKDGTIVVHHDAKLDRTTSGSGLVAESTLPELKRLRLKDSAGHLTEFQIPTLDEVLEWARDKTILLLDQKDVPVAARVRKIKEHKAEAYAMLIVYSFKEAQECHSLNPNIMMEVMIPNREKVADFNKTGVPWQNIVAFVGHTPPDDAKLFEAIHAKGSICIVGTSRNLDRQLASTSAGTMERLAPQYRALFQRGVDLVETDLPIRVARLLNHHILPSPSKAKFLRRN